MKKFVLSLMSALLVFTVIGTASAEDQRYCLKCAAEVTSNFCPDCGHASTASLPELAEGEAYLALNICYEKNHVLAKYDVDVKIDGESIGMVSQQETLQQVIAVKKGMCEITLCKGDSAEASILVDVTTNAQLSFTLKAHMFSLELKDVVNSAPASEEAALAFEISRKYGTCEEVEHEHFARYPEEVKKQPIHLGGQVVAVSENFSGVMKLVVKDDEDDLWIVEYDRKDDAARVLINDQVNVYGSCKGLSDYKSSVDAYLDLPTVAVEFLTFN